MYTYWVRGVMVKVFDVTFSDISVISWRSVLLVEETGVSGEKHWLTCRKSLTNFITMFYQVHLARAEFKFTTLVVIGTDCTGSYKSNYHTINTTTAHIPFGGKIKMTKIWSTNPNLLIYIYNHLNIQPNSHRVQANIREGGCFVNQGVYVFFRLFLPVAERKVSMNYK